MKLNDEFFDKIAAKIIKRGEPDDLAKFMLSGEEHIAAVQRYFEHLEADKKKKLTLIGDRWYLQLDNTKNSVYTGLPLFKLVAPFIIPYVEELHINCIQLKDYSFLSNIKNLDKLWLIFADDEHTNVLAALTSLQGVGWLTLNINGVNIQFLSSLSFFFYRLEAYDFIFEADPKRDKIFQTARVFLRGNKELKNDFVFTRENYQNYATIFPNAIHFFTFDFYIKIGDDISDFLKVSNFNHIDDVKVPNRDMGIHYHFFDYSGYPNSKVMKMLEDDEDWNTYACPYEDANTEYHPVEVTCNFPLAIAEVGNRLAERSLWRIPEGSSGNPEDYYRINIGNEFNHNAKFEVLKDILVEDLCKAYCAITGMNDICFRFEVFDDDDDVHSVSNDGTVADNFQDGDVVMICFD